MSKIGIGVTITDDRGTYLDKLYEYMPPNAQLIVVRDVSPIAKAKNHCLKALEGNQHIFLFDSDCYPIEKDWWVPYVNHPEPHLMFQFDLPNKKLAELYRDDKTVSYDKTRGAMIYLERRVLDIVGGFDERFHNSHEHPNLTDRIHNAGLTIHRAMDVPNSHELLYCLDQDQKIESSIKLDYKTKRDNYKLYNANRNSREWMPYK